jgi:hypothetical protein
LIPRSDIAGWRISLLFAGFAETFAGIVRATAIMPRPAPRRSFRRPARRAAE